MCVSCCSKQLCLFYYPGHFVGFHGHLSAVGHFFESYGAFGEFAFADNGEERHVHGVCKAYLLFHLGVVGINFSRYSAGAQFFDNCKRCLCFFLTEICEEYACGLGRLVREEIEGKNDIIDAVCTELYAHARYAVETEYARKVVIASAP